MHPSKLHSHQWISLKMDAFRNTGSCPNVSLPLPQVSEVEVQILVELLPQRIVQDELENSLHTHTHTHTRARTHAHTQRVITCDHVAATDSPDGSASARAPSLR